MSYDVVQAWLNNVAYAHSRNQNTEMSYRLSLKRFCEFLGIKPEDILKQYESMDERQFRRNYAQHLRAFISELGSDATPSTVSSRVNAVKSFFKYNDLPLGYVPFGRKKITYHNRDITKEEIQNILKASRPRDKAFYCMMAQGGLRPETLCNLKLKHIEPEFSKGVIPCKVDVPQELAKGEYGSYFTFIGEESLNFLKAYFSTRPNLTKDDYLFTNYGTKDQANPKSFSRIFARTIQKLREKGIIDYEFRGNRKPSELRLYNLRKYFKKHAGQMGSEESEFLMGHRQGVKDHYLPKDPEHYRELYREKAMPFLRLETATATEHDTMIRKQEEEIDDLKQKVNDLTELLEGTRLAQPEIDRMREQLNKWESERELREQESNQLNAWEHMLTTLNKKKRHEFIDAIAEEYKKLEKGKKT